MWQWPHGTSTHACRTVELVSSSTNSRYHTLHVARDGCYGMISLSLPFREGGGERLRRGKLAAAAASGIHEPSRRTPFDGDGEAIPLPADEIVR